MKKLILSIFLIAASLLSINAQNVNLKVGTKAPDWVFTDSDGTEFSMSDYSDPK